MATLVIKVACAWYNEFSDFCAGVVYSIQLLFMLSIFHIQLLQTMAYVNSCCESLKSCLDHIYSFMIYGAWLLYILPPRCNNSYIHASLHPYMLLVLHHVWRAFLQNAGLLCLHCEKSAAYHVLLLRALLNTDGL